MSETPPAPAAPTAAPSLGKRAWQFFASNWSSFLSIAAITSAFTLYTQWYNFRKEIEKDIAIRFATSVENLDNDRPGVRIGALYALNRIADLEEIYRKPTHDILSVYIQSHSLRRPPDSSSTPLAVASPIISGIGGFLQNDTRVALDILVRSISSHRQDSAGHDEDGLKRCTDLSGTDLRGASFVDITLDGYCFVGSDLSRVYFSESKLKHVEFRSSVMYGAVFAGDNTNIEGVSFSNADLTDADFSDASLIRVDFDSGAILDGSKWLSSDLKDVKFTGADLTGADFGGRSVIENVYFDEHAQLEGAWFNSSNLNHVYFTGANITGGHFFDADLECVYFNGSNLSADFSSAEFRFVNLQFADLSGATISADQIQNPYWDASTIWPGGEFVRPSSSITMAELTEHCGASAAADGP